jgi:outer membrane protein TolC
MKMQAGISTALDVNNTQNQLIQAQSGLIGAKIAYLNQLSALQRTLGTTLEHWNIKLRYGE